MAKRTLNIDAIQLRRDTAANWETKNPVLSDGERILVVTNAGATRTKTGDGTKTYTQLPFDDEPLYNALSGKVNNDQGAANAGKVLAVGSDGSVTLVTAPSVGGSTTWGDLKGI